MEDWILDLETLSYLHLLLEREIFEDNELVLLLGKWENNLNREILGKNIYISISIKVKWQAIEIKQLEKDVKAPELKLTKSLHRSLCIPSREPWPIE